ncbi:hypothetical protein EXIGLDRAFT_846594 [Exidia glandulosa HHB12029]|uniref:Uncharacterized protein n=1 Tax=Exidia glandulosa HHB12029 TaxID=1314781 RepID=A0A165ATJ2_EXIGL|nr:hypothetical protein EXIGLDRAFT_846594 [Exidia glandulosa HHB12029]
MTSTLVDNSVSAQMLSAFHTATKATRELADHLGTTTNRFLTHLELLERRNRRRNKTFKEPKYPFKGKKVPKPPKAKKAPRMPPPADTNTKPKQHRKRRNKNKGVKIDKIPADGAPAATTAETDTVMPDATPPATPAQALVPFTGSQDSTAINFQYGDPAPQFVPGTLGINSGTMTPHPGLGHDNWHAMTNMHAMYGFGTAGDVTGDFDSVMTPGTAISMGMYGAGETIDPSDLLVTTDAQMGMEQIFDSVDTALAGDGVDGMIETFGTALAI